MGSSGLGSCASKTLNFDHGPVLILCLGFRDGDLLSNPKPVPVP